MSLIARCVVCDALLSAYNGDCVCHRCKAPCPVCGGDVAHCHHPLPTEEQAKFWARVDRRGEDECWPWLGEKMSTGYGYFRIVDGKRRRAATQIIWELTNGRPFPAGRLACHSCDNPICVNPAHIWPGTHKENTADALAKGRLHQQRVTHCPRNHEYSPDNTRVYRGRRFCRACERQRTIDRAEQRRLARFEMPRVLNEQTVPYTPISFDTDPETKRPRFAA